MRCAGPPYALWSFVVIILTLSNLVGSSSVNHTIDDVNGDSLTGALVQYLPVVPPSDTPLWFNQTSCAGCADVPDATFAFDKTWSAALYQENVGSLSVSMKFTGTAIYVFFILPNFLPGSHLASAVLCDFFIDGVHVGSFTHQSDGSGAFTYNALVYNNTSVQNGDHVLLIETTGSEPAIIIFDHALYTKFIPDSPSPSAPVASSSSSFRETVPSPTFMVSDGDTGTSTSQLPSSSPQTDTVPAFPTAPGTPTPSALPSSALPFLLTGSPSGATQPFATTPPSLGPSADSETDATQRSTPVIAIVGGVAGGLILIVLLIVFFVMLRRRRLAQRTGTVSVFDLIDDNPPPPPPRAQRSPPRSPERTRARPLPMPPMSEQRGGRTIDATQTKMQMQMQMHEQAPYAGPSGSGSGAHSRSPPPFAGIMGSAHHSAQSSVSSYADSRSDLHIHIPMTSFRPAYSPSPRTVTPSHTPSHSHSYSNSQSHSQSHSHQGYSQTHAHSPITRNGVPVPPEQADFVRGLVLGLRVDTSSVRRGSEGSVCTPTTETGQEDDDELWGPPVVHVDSGIRISRAMMELPPEYAAA